MLRVWVADLHVHTALSPCADNEMTPPQIVKAARARGLGLLAITDHNSAQNARAVVEAARGSGLVVVPGLEVQTREEVHIICLFRQVERAEAWQDVVYRRLPDMENREDLFGQQLVLDKSGRTVGRVQRLLLTSADLSVDETVRGVGELGGICIAAHVDRPSFSLLEALGFMPPHVDLVALEISREGSAAQVLRRFPSVGGFAIVSGSDAHWLADIGTAATEILAGEPGLGELELAVRGREGRKVVSWTGERGVGLW